MEGGHNQARETIRGLGKCRKSVRAPPAGNNSAAKMTDKS
jgi:hypothetical protein